MPSIFDLLYREYCRARLAEMRKQLLISPVRHEAICDATDNICAGPASQVSGDVTALIVPVVSVDPTKAVTARRRNSSRST